MKRYKFPTARMSGTTKSVLGLVVLTCLAWTLGSTPALAEEETNGVSQFPIEVDGQFIPGVEWSDIRPLAFISLPDGTLVATQENDPQANSFLYAALAPEADTGQVEDLYLMYDYLPTTIPFALPGDVLARINFPVTLPPQLGGGKQVITVRAVARTSFFDVVFDVEIGGLTVPIELVSLDLQGAVGFGPSPNSPTPHLLVELEVPLRIPAGFAAPGGPLPPAGINPATGLYDPDPQFWTGEFAGNRDQGKPPGDPLGSSALFQINPDGSVTANSDVIVTQIVNVDCKPGSFPNSVNRKSNGVLPVAILSTATFDATTVNPATVKLNGVGPPRRAAVEDVDGDGDLDMILHFRIPDLVAGGALPDNTTVVVLTGQTLGGATIGGSDSVRLVH